MKIFKKTKKTNGRRHIYLCGIKIFSYKRQKKSSRAYELSDIEIVNYLSKYKYVLDNLPTESISDKYKHCIWQCWLQGMDNRPAIVQKCMASVKKFSGGRKIIVLTEDNIHEYVQLPDYIWDKYKKGMISPAHFSDIVRVSLLAKYGGTWIDATVLLTGKIPDEILKSDFFVFKDCAWFPSFVQCDSFGAQVPSDYLINRISGLLSIKADVPNISNWFIHATPNNVMICSIKALLLEYWKNETKAFNYYIFHYFLNVCLLYSKECKTCFENMFSVSNRDVHFLQSIMFDSFNEDLFQEIKSLSPIHKMTYKGIENDVLADSFFKHILKD